MSDFIDGKDLKAHWGKRGFELFGYLNEGLQPYTPHGQKIINTDALEYGRKKPIEWYETKFKRLADLEQGVQETGKVVGSGESREVYWTGRRIKEEAKKEFEEQPLEPVNPTPHRMNFTLPHDVKEASKVLFKLNFLLFKKDEASEFAEQHGLRPLDDHGVDQPSVSAQEEGEKRAGETSSENECLSSRLSDITEQDQNILCETFVRSLRFYFENPSEVKIQEPKKTVKTFNHESLGFDREDTAEWEWFIRVIKGPEHFYKYGPSKMRKEYDINRRRLIEINKKLLDFFQQKYDLEVPEGFKTHERAAAEGQGVHKFKFQIGPKVEKSKYDGYTEEDLVDEIERLSGQVRMASHNDDPTKDAQLSKDSEALEVAATCAYKKGLITEKKMSEYLHQETWDPQEQVYASPKRFPNADSIANSMH